MASVIPGAPNSFGMSTRAAYGNSGTPTVYKVTSLGDSGLTTQFRHGAESSGNRVIIFEVSGYIDLASDVNINNPYLTVAGQTAPSPGITFRNYGFLFGAHDVLFQHIAIRPGGDTCNSSFQAYGGNQYNIVLDHVSMCWGQDENMATNWTNGQDTNLTMWRCLMAEGLYRAPGSDACSGGGFSNGHGFLVASGSKTVAIIQCLFANNFERNPYMQGDTSVVLMNNVIYQWHGPWGIFFNNANVSSTGAAGPWYASVVGNRFIKGPNSTDGSDPSAYMFVYSINDFGETSGNQIYKSDNTIANQDGSVVLESNQYSYNPVVGSPPTTTPIPVGYTALASTATEAIVLANCGSRPFERDATDTRIVATVTNRNGDFVAHPNDVGGYPSLTPGSRSLTVPSNPHVDSGNGYTNLEVWLHGYAAGVEGDATDPPPSQRNVAGGHTVVNATFTGATGTDLTAYTSNTGGGWTLHPSSSGVLELSNANRVLNSSVGVGGLTLANGVPLSAEYDVFADFRVLTLISGSSYSIWARTSTTTEDGYLCGYNVDAGAWELSSVMSGTYAVLGTSMHALSTSTTYQAKFVVRDDGLEFWVDGERRINSDTAPALTGKGRAGLAVYASATADTNTTGIHFDNFLVTDVRTYPFVWPKGGGM